MQRGLPNGGEEAEVRNDVVALYRVSAGNQLRSTVAAEFQEKAPEDCLDAGPSG